MRGFTLIELLAVIVILVIILIISVPIIGNLIDDSKRSAFESSVYGLVEGAKLELMKESLGGTTADKMFIIEDFTLTTGTLEYDGDLPENGKIYVKNDGRVAYAMHNGKYCMEKGYGTDVSINEKELVDCVVPIGPPVITYSTNGGTGNPVSTSANVVAMDNPISTIEYKWSNSTDLPTNGYTTYTNGATLNYSTIGTYYLHIKVTDIENNVTNVVSNAFIIPVPGPAPLTTTIPAGYTPVYKIEDMINMNGKYILMSNIDFNEDACYSNIANKATYTTGLGWTPQTAPLIFDGNGLEIRNLYINRPSNGTPTGLFRDNVNFANVSNVILKNANVTGNTRVGVLFGQFTNYSSGFSQISNVKVMDSTVKGYTMIGGIAGGTESSAASANRINIYKSIVENTTLSTFYSASTNNTWMGGLVGRVNPMGNNQYIQNNYVMNVTISNGQSQYVGGLFGTTVGGTNNALYNYSVATASTSNVYVNGLSGWDQILNSYYNSTAPFINRDGYNNAAGKTTAQMKQQATYVGWDFTNTWIIDEGNDYPRLRWER